MRGDERDGWTGISLSFFFCLDWNFISSLSKRNFGSSLSKRNFISSISRRVRRRLSGV